MGFASTCKQALILTLALSCLGPPAAAQPGVLQPTADAPLYVADLGGTLLIAEGGEPVVFELPRDTRIDRLARTEGGWIATGRYAAKAGGELLLLERSEGTGIELLPVPPERHGLLRAWPAPLITGGQVGGLAWLEGDGRENLGVYAATWDGTDWGPIETISPAGDHAQLALSATVLADGSFLLVWAAVDGDDDEVLWSRRVGGIWTPAERLHPDNQVPDITPTVAALGDGALAAWSSFDGRDYRIRLARFDGAGWQPVAFNSGRGAVSPVILPHAENCSLLYQSVEPATWNTVDFDRAGRPTRRAAVANRRTDRPLVERGPPPSLTWPHPFHEWPPESVETVWELLP